MLSYTIADIILHVILISSFLVIFFFTYAAKVEKAIVIRQSTDIVKDVIESTTVIFPDFAIKDMSEFLNAHDKTPDMAEQDAKIEKSNKELLDNTVKMISIVCVVGVLGVYVMSRIFKFSMTDLLIRNLIIVSFVALTEFLFLTYFAQNYDSIDSNFVKYKVLQTINTRI